MSPVRTWFAILLIAVGGLWLADASGLLDAGEVIATWWPLALIGLGLTTVAVERCFRPGSIALLVIGTVLLLARTTGLDAAPVFWACGAILLGGLLLVRRVGRPAGSERSAGGSTLAIFSGARQVVQTDHFRHADVSAVFGSATLDLREAHLDAGATVDATAVFGGVEVLVPPGWRVELSGLPLFGGYDDKTRGPQPLPVDAPVLRVVATAVFGGVTVKSPLPV